LEGASSTWTRLFFTSGAALHGPSHRVAMRACAEAAEPLPTDAASALIARRSTL